MARRKNSPQKAAMGEMMVRDEQHTVYHFSKFG